jgi:uncharacterized protein (TIGR02147 family)
MNLFHYTDFRSFLSDHYAHRKKQDPKFSHRFFAQKAGIRSSGFFSDVLKGRRNLTTALIMKFSEALKLKPNERDYFENLVRFTQARNLSEKSHYYEKMLSFQNIKAEILGRHQYEFYSKWYYSAIRELINFLKFKDDYTGLAKKLDPVVTPSQARKAVRILEKLGLIKKGADGAYQQTSAIITTGKEFRSINVANFQKATMDLAREAIERHPRENRDISTLTVTLSEDSVSAVKNEIGGLRKKVLSLARAEQKADRVYQVNFQLFPLSKF